MQWSIAPAKGLPQPIIERMFVYRLLLDRARAAMTQAKFVQKNGSGQNVEIGENVSVMLATVSLTSEVQS
jgi:hypothetical protein